MRKILSMIMVLLLAASMVSLALADEAEDIDKETEEETVVMHYPFGAEVRLLQLERALTKNIVIGGEVIIVVQEIGGNTSELEAILAEMELLLEEVKAADPNSTDAVQYFVDLKIDAIELTKEFRETVRELLDEETAEQLRERIRERLWDELEDLRQRIRNRIREYNRNQLHGMYGFLGLVDNGLLEQYKNGNISIGEIKSQINKSIQLMSKEEIKEAYAELKEARIRNRIHSIVKVENVSQNIQERKQTRLNNRYENTENINDEQLRERIQQRINNRKGGK